MRPVVRTISRLSHPSTPQPVIPQSFRAAQYVRMSTDHQKYSIDNQVDVISTYAAIHNYTIVRTYTDAGRSGLRIEGRDALQQLIEDVQNGSADFNTVLVYDVSRWGRFQDADEAAHYEFMCKRAGVDIKYCAEQFENDGSFITTLAKGMKRAMAAEFSRELSTKVLNGQKRLAGLGFCRGSAAGFGLRRMLIDEERRPKLLLKFHEEKHLQTDRVILVPGPVHEVKIVRDIFHMFVDDHVSPTHIAQILNKKGIANARGNRWTTNNVFKVLKNESYIGNLVYNRTTEKLLSKRRPNPPELWVRKKGAFEAIVDRSLFEAAQNIMSHSWTYTDGELLNYLTALLCVHGRLSSRLIAKRKCGPSIGTYYERFGKLSNAFRAIGYRVTRSKAFFGDPAYKPRLNKGRPDNSKLWKHSQLRYRP